MQRRIILMRHGHAEERPDDYVRPLSDAGRAAVVRAGTALTGTGWLPDHVLTSSAPRALETAELVAKACGHRGPIRGDRSLYLAGEGRYLAALQDLSTRARCVLMVGHNPGLSALARQLFQHERDMAPAEYVSALFTLAEWSELA
jgi:phosphohistidine phosphatase